MEVEAEEARPLGLRLQSWQAAGHLVAARTKSGNTKSPPRPARSRAARSHSLFSTAAALSFSTTQSMTMSERIQGAQSS